MISPEQWNFEWFEDGDDLPENETVQLITGITRVFHTPTMVEGETSSTGKTISVTDPHGDRTYRLDTEEILRGQTEFRDATYFEIYTPYRLKKRQRSNCQPGPRAGVNEIQRISELPAPTHCPADENPFGSYTND